MEAGSLDALKRAVGGYIEVVKAGERLDLVFNEDGAHDLLGTFGGHSIRGGPPGAEGQGGRPRDVTDDDIAEVVARFVPAKTLN
jgi:hypothetical protein